MIVLQLLCGIVFFLLGFRYIEEGIGSMTGRTFKLFLKKQTNHPLKGILGGTLLTALLQSSSLVNFLVLSFVGTGVLKMHQALAVILGNNLGSTVSNWIIATVGFKVNLDILSLPLICFFGFIVLFYNKANKIMHWSRLLFGMGFLFFGLEFIKTSVAGSLQTYDFSFLNQYPLIVFLGFGLVATSLTQSSSVTIALTLSALNADGITLIAAMAIVLGSEVGTSLKLGLAAMGGPSIKKKVALANLVFNGVTTVLAFALIQPAYHLIKSTMLIEDNLIALVMYQSMINLACILLFLPILSKFGNWLDQHAFKEDEETDIIHKVKVNEGEYAHNALDQEAHRFLMIALYFSRKSFELDDLEGWKVPKKLKVMDRVGLYVHIKLLHGDIRNYALALQKLNYDPEKQTRISQLMEAVRDAMYAIKSLKDSFQDLDLLRNSSNDIKYGLYQKTKKEINTLTGHLALILIGEKDDSVFEKLLGHTRYLEEEYHVALSHFYKDGMELTLSAADFSTLINFNREIFNASKYLVIMVKEFVLDFGKAEKFDELLHRGI